MHMNVLLILSSLSLWAHFSASLSSFHARRLNSVDVVSEEAVSVPQASCDVLMRIRGWYLWAERSAAFP